MTSAKLLQRKLSNLLPGWSNRATYVGMTGSGKTTLAALMTRFYKYVVVLDIKADLKAKDFQGFHIVDSLQKLTESKAEKLLFRPKRQDARLDAIREANSVVSQFYEWVYMCGNRVCLTDEVSAICKGDYMPDAYFDILTRGRSKGVMAFNLTQRPAWIPNVIFSESEDKYIFRLELFADRKKVEQMTGIDEKKIHQLQKFQFIHSRLGEVSDVLKIKL